MLTFEFNTGIIEIPIFLQSMSITFKEKKKNQIAVSVYGYLTQAQANKVKADLDVTLFPQITFTLNVLTLVEYSNPVLNTQAGN